MEPSIVSSGIVVNPFRSYPKKILVVEDEPSWQAILSQSIRNGRAEEIDIRFVRNSKQALDMIHNRGVFDLIISDHYIDGALTGFELWAKCKAMFVSIPFIIVSGKDRREFEQLKTERLSRLPLIVQKPFNPQHFKAVLDLYLNK